MRTAIGGVGVRQSAAAGLVFAGLLIALTLLATTRVTTSAPALLTGFIGGLLLCVPALLARSGSPLPMGDFLSWAAIVSVVALAEEAFLRGALFDALTRWRGDAIAVAVTAIAFAAMHIPLYGWRAIWLDGAVGLWLGMLRSISKSFVAPGIAHVIADLAAWGLR